MANLNSNANLARDLYKSTMTMDNLSHASANISSNLVNNNSNNDHSSSASHANISISKFSNYRKSTHQQKQAGSSISSSIKSQIEGQEEYHAGNVSDYTDNIKSSKKVNDTKSNGTKQANKTIHPKDSQQLKFDIPSYDIPQRHFMNGLLKHTGIALLIIIPLAAYSAFV